jgi:hypothetical protein
MSERSKFLAELRTIWRGIIGDEGGYCPCCDRWGKIYPRTLNKTMARSLVWLAHHSIGNDDWIDVPKDGPRWLIRSNQLPALRWWGLIHRLDTEDEAQKHSGLWRATKKGILFAQNRLQVPKKVYTYNAEVEGFSEELITIKDCVESFDYSAVMESNT